MLGGSLVAGFVGAPFIQGAMRAFEITIGTRAAIEVGLIAWGVLAIYRRPPQGGVAGPGSKNWDTFPFNAFLVSLGAFTMVDGVVINAFFGS